MRRPLAILTAIAALATFGATSATAQSGIMWRPDDRVLLSDFSNVLALARDNTTLYAATPYGLLRYDLARRKFALPLTMEDGYPADERPTAVAYAPSDFTLVIGTAAGGIFTLTSNATRFDNITRLPGPISRLVAQRGELDTYAQVGPSWYRLRGGSMFADQAANAPRIVTPGATDPYLRSMLATAGSITGRFTAPVVALEADRTEGSYFAGTSGNGLIQLDTRTLERTRLAYGLNTRGAGAVALWRGRIFFGGDARVTTGTIVSATPDLAAFSEYPIATGAPQDPITALLATDSTLWVGTTAGLYALSGPAGNERWQAWTREVRDPVTSLTSAVGSVFAGTSHGLVRLTAAGGAEPVLSGRYVYGAAPARDTLWIACDVGLAAYPLRPGDAPAAALQGGGSPDMAVLDVRMVGDTLFAVTRDRLFRRGPAGWVAPDPSLGQRLGPMGRIRTDGSTIWVLGTLGFAVKRAQSALWTYYTAPDDIPEAPVRDLLPLGQTLWLASPAGALRVPIPR